MPRPFRLPMLVGAVVVLSLCVSDATQQVVGARSTNGLAYDLVGEGPLVAPIHGTNLDRRMWDAEAEWLQEHARVLRHDLRGQGESDFPTDPYSNHDDLIRLLDELGARDVTLVGLWAGAQVAIDVALAAPRLVARLLLVSPSVAGCVPAEMPAFLAELTTSLQAGDFDRANTILLASPIMTVPAEYAARVRVMVEDNTRLWTIPYSLVEQPSPLALERLEDIEAPTLVLVGENDVEAIRAQGTLLQRRMADARLVMISGGGHLLNLTSPESFREALSGFLGIPTQ